MSITVTSMPSANINGNASDKSYWQAVHNPVKWEFKRKDRDPVYLYDAGSGSGLAYYTIASLVVDEVEGEYVYYESVADSIYETFLIVTVAVVGADTWIFVAFDLNAIGTSTGFINYISARKNHFIEIGIYSINQLGVEVLLGTMRSICNQYGIATANVMEYLKGAVDYYESFNHDETLFIDETLGGQYTLYYRESYNQTVTTYAEQSLATLGAYYTNSAKQLQDNYGSNMAAYVPSLLIDEAVFMSDFEAPTFTDGLPFSLTFVLSRNITHHVRSIVEMQCVYKDVNGTTISTDNVNIYDASNEPGVARFMYPNAIPSNTKTIATRVRSSDGSYSYNTSTINVKYNDVCQYENPVYLNWLGTNGGRNYWLFEKVQTSVLEVKDTGEFYSQDIDLATDLGTGNYTGKNATPMLICYAVLEVADIEALKGLLMSPDVLMLTNPDTWLTDGATSPISALPIWKRVKLLPQTFKILETNQTHSEIEFTLILPNINIQKQ